MTDYLIESLTSDESRMFTNRAALVCFAKGQGLTLDGKYLRQVATGVAVYGITADPGICTSNFVGIPCTLKVGHSGQHHGDVSREARAKRIAEMG